MSAQLNRRTRSLPTPDLWVCRRSILPSRVNCRKKLLDKRVVYEILNVCAGGRYGLPQGLFG